MSKSRSIPAQPWLPRWLLILYSTLTVCLIPWILLLSYELPTRHIFRNWGMAWVGFDILLCIVLAATAFLGYRRSHWVIMSASALTTLLLVDAWFDVLSSRPGPQLTFSLACASCGAAARPLVAVVGDPGHRRLIASQVTVVTRAGLQSWAVKLVSATVFINGLLAIFRPLAEHIPERIESLISPIAYEDFARSLDLALGFILVYVSVQLWHRKLAAWWIATVVAWLLVIVSLLRPIADITIIGPFLAGVMLLLCRPYFRVKSEPRSIKQGIVVFALSVALALTYGTVGFYLMGRHNFRVPMTPFGALQHALNSYLLLSNPDIIPHTRHARWFLDSLNFLGIASLTYGLYSLFRPLDYRYRTLPYERQVVQDLIAAHGCTSEDFFKAWPHDKSYFFAPGNRAVIAYGVKSGSAVCVGDPVGEPAAIPGLLRSFQEHCLASGWTLSFIYVTGNLLRTYQEADLNVLKIGEDALIDVPNFATETSRNKHFRNIGNRFAKAGYVTAWSAPPHSAALLREISAVSRAWITDAGRREWGFIAGSFSAEYMQQCRLFLVRDESGRVRAFANEIPAGASGQASIDLMRYEPASPSNLMDFLFLRLLSDLHEQGVATFNLGLAPLSGLDEGETRPEQRLLHLVYRLDQPLLSFKGLRQFKAKFEPNWEPRYLAYQGASTQLARIALALARVSRAD